MPDKIRIKLEPLGKTLEVDRGVALREVLFEFGVEFPCGGHGRCKACRIRVLEGALPSCSDEEAILSPRELADGWRLACRSRASSDLTIGISQWEAPVLSDDTSFDFRPLSGSGIAVDLGTTTIVAQLLDLKTGHVLSVKSGLNPQAAYGGDVMSRVQYALDEDGLARMSSLIRDGMRELLSSLLESAEGFSGDVRELAVVGNTVMHHLFCGIDVTPLAYYPFAPEDDGTRVFTCSDLGWRIPGDPRIRFLPCLGGFVGSDILAGILATKLHQSRELVGLIDLGTNGEVVFGNAGRILCASTAAGPAFEGARIGMGMRAATGAIAEVSGSAEGIRCRVLGGGSAKGLCGSGLVDAAAVGLERGLIGRDGRLSVAGDRWMFCPPVFLAQSDIRELQLAKGAIAAAVRLLLRRLDAGPADVARLYLAGAFGNYVDRGSARRIGLVEFEEEKIRPAGNTALQGAKLALFETEDPEYAAVRRRIEHVALSAEPDFQDMFVDCIAFP